MRKSPLLAALLAASLLCGRARADDAAVREGRWLFAQGNQHIQDGDYAGALELFQRAYTRYPNVKILLNIGTMLRQLGRNAEAVNAYEAYLRDPAADPGRKAEVEKLLAALDARVAKLRVVVDDPNAKVLVDGKEVGRVGGVVSMRVEPGPHAISVERGAGPPTAKNIEAVAGQEVLVSLDVALPNPPALPAPATPAPAPSPPVATEPTADAKRVGGFIAGGIGIAGLAAGGVTGIVALVDHSDVESLCPSHKGCSQEVVNLASTGKSLSIASTVAFAAGAVGVGLGVYLVLSSGGQKAAPTLGLTLSSDGGRMGIHGRF